MLRRFAPFFAGILCPLCAWAAPGLQGQPNVPAIASISVPTNGTWFVLDELMTVGSYYSPVYSYTAATALQLDVTDLFVVSDQNEVYVDGGLLGATPAMADWQSLFPAVGPTTDAPFTSLPGVAWTRPQFSKQSFLIPAGTHLLTFRNIHIPSDENNIPYTDGTVAFRIVPEPSAFGMLLVAGGVAVAARRRGGARRRTIGRAAMLAAAFVGAGLFSAQDAQAGTPCGSLTVSVGGNVLDVVGTTGPDSIRIKLNAGNPAIVEIYEPVGAGSPVCSYDSTATPFNTIHVVGGDGDDLILFDDSSGAVSSLFALNIEGGDGADVAFGGLDLNAIPLSSAMSMITTLQQARDLVDRSLDLLDASPSGCASVPCLVENAATTLRDTGANLVVPTGQYVRDMETELVQPAAAAVRDAHDRIATYLQNFVANEVVDVADEAQTFSADVEVKVNDFELLFPVAQGLLIRAETLYQHASNLGLSTQSGNGPAVFQSTIQNHVLSIQDFADICAEDPEPVENQFDENLQDPSGLPSACAEVERRIEGLEAIVDSVEGYIDGVEVEGDGIETDGNALEATGDSLGDDENPGSHAAQIATGGDNLVMSGDVLSAAADAINADWEQWVGTVEADLEGRGNTMYNRGLTDVEGAANTLDAQAQANVLAASEALRAEANAIIADLNTVLSSAAPLLGPGVTLGGNGALGSGCNITTTNTISGGAGPDVLIGSTGSDEINGGDGDDLIVGFGGGDRLNGDDGNDLIIGGAGADEIHGGPKVDILIGLDGDDCIFGGGGQTLTRGSLSVELGDIFVGWAGNDQIVSGEAETDTLTEIDVVFAGDGDDRVRVSHGGTLTVGSFSIQLGNLVFGGAGQDDILTADGIDVIFGGDDNDTIATGKGAQLTIGSGSNQFRLALGDLIFAGDGDDTIDSDDPAADRADDDIDVIFGGAGNDVIHAYGGGMLSVGDVSNPDFELQLGNLVFGQTGNDTIDTLDGIDVIFGGDNDDEISTAKGALLKIGSGSNEFRLALGDLIFAGEGDDTVDSDDPDGDRDDDDIDVVFGGPGADTINGYGGGKLSIGDESNPDFELKLGNVIFGGDGDDAIVTLDGIDFIFAGADNDTVEAGNGDKLDIDNQFTIELGDLIFGQGGDDTLHGDTELKPDPEEVGGIDVIFGGPGADQIYGGAGGKIELPEQDFCLQWGNLLFGGPDDDLIRGDYSDWDSSDPIGGIDLIFGAGGNDTIEGAGGSLIIVGDLSAGQAVVIFFGNILFGGPGNDIIKGADSGSICTGVNEDLDDLLSGLGVADLGGAADLIFCGSGDDDVDAYNGIDFVFGGDGDDTLRADNGGIVIVPISGVPTPIAFGNLMFGSDGEDNIRSLGRLLLPTVPPMEIDLLFGGPCDDVISAGDGFNLVFGNKANDTITAGDGINVLFGNSGQDNITAGDGLNIAFGNSDNDVVNAGDGVNVLFGNRGDDQVNGGDGVNIEFGNRGDDIVTGGNGLALLFGNNGVDRVQGGAGLNIDFGNRGDDIVQAGSGLAVLFGNAGNDQVTGANGLCLAFGNADHDIVSAGAGLNILFGNSGEDRISSGSGLSVLFGNADNDIIQANGAGLFVAFGNNNDDVIVSGGGLSLNFGNRGSDQVFGGSGVNISFGGQDTDYIRGGGSVDFLFGNGGGDFLAGGGSKDFMFGNAGNDCLSSEGGGDFVFGNRGNDEVRSGSDGECDYLFGNRGNDSLYRCQNCDKRFGGRGSDSKSDSCDGCSLPNPSRGEVRGTVLIDIDGDGVGDVGHAGVTVFVGASSAVTDADGNYRIANLAIGSYTVSETVPAGYTQISLPTTYSVSINAPGLDLHLNRDFVNRERCFVSVDAWGCLGNACQNAVPGVECRPVAVRQVMRCPQTGAICDVDHDCPCADCVPSWAVVECACVNTASDCYITLTSAGPICGGQCVANGQVRPCELVQEGDIYRCHCVQQPPCPTDFAQFRFTGTITGVGGSRPAPWNTITVGMPWSVTYWFVRNTPDQSPDPNNGDYPAVAYYQLQVGPIIESGGLTPAATNIHTFAGMVLAFDDYVATWPLISTGNPVFRLFLRDATGTAWIAAGLNPLDSLPQCGDIVLDRFGEIRQMTVGQSVPGSQWSIRGSVTAHDCVGCAPPLPVVQARPTPRPARIGPDRVEDGAGELPRGKAALPGEQPADSLRKP